MITKRIMHIPFIDANLIKELSNKIENVNNDISICIEQPLREQQHYDFTLENSQEAIKKVSQIWLKQISYALPLTIQNILKQKNLCLTVNSSINKIYILNEVQYQIMAQMNVLN